MLLRAPFSGGCVLRNVSSGIGEKAFLFSNSVSFFILVRERNALSPFFVSAVPGEELPARSGRTDEKGPDA